MSIVSWNCQGLRRSQDLAIQRLKELRKNHFPEILFLMETMHGRDVLVDLQVWLGYERVYTVEPVGKSGGLALFIKSGVTVDLKFIDKNLMDMQIQFGAVTFFLSCVYGDPNFKRRKENWERLCRIGVGRKDSWCLIGDFNDILHNGEKLGGPSRCDSIFKPFSEMLDVCDMMELPSQGNRFTWAGKRYDLWIQSRLDRAFGSKEWFSQFPASNQAFLDMRGSDHRPVLLKLLDSQDKYRGQFRFDRRFLYKPLVEEAVAQAWSGVSRNVLESVSQGLRKCRRALSSWKKDNSLNAQDAIHQFENALEVEQSSISPRFSLIHNLKHDLRKAYRDEEDFWSQRSRHKWLRCGNGNSKFFHASVRNNRSRKRIEFLLDANGISQKSEATKGEVAYSYFQKLFTSSNPSSFDEWFSDLPAKVTEVMNLKLIEDVTKEEIKEALFSIKPSSAPGPDVCMPCSFNIIGI